MPCSTTASLVWVHYVGSTPAVMDIGDTAMVQNGEWHEAEAKNSPPTNSASVPSMESTACTLLCQVEEKEWMAEDEGGMGDRNHSYWQV